MWRATDWIDQLSRQGGLAPRDPALPIDLDQLRVRTRPDKDQAFLARLEQTASSELGQGSQGLALLPAHDVGPHPAVGAGAGRRSQSRHEMDRPRPDLWKCTSHHGIGQLTSAITRDQARTIAGSLRVVVVRMFLAFLLPSVAGRAMLNGTRVVTISQDGLRRDPGRDRSSG